MDVILIRGQPAKRKPKKIKSKKKKKRIVSSMYMVELLVLCCMGSFPIKMRPFQFRYSVKKSRG